MTGGREEVRVFDVDGELMTPEEIATLIGETLAALVEERVAAEIRKAMGRVD